MSLIRIWKSRNQILEGVKNSVFKKRHIEEIAEARRSICEMCPLYDSKGEYCAVAGTAPCCGDCGCSLLFKTRSLSSSCPKGFWLAVVTEDEEDAIVESIKRLSYVSNI